MTRQKKTVSRRGFGKTIAAAAVALPAASQALAQQRDDENDLSDAEKAEVSSQMENILRKYGDRLSDEQKEQLRDNLEGIQRRLRPLREFPLDNGDTPASRLKLALGDGPRPAVRRED
jgi:hypothetical protein